MTFDNILQYGFEYGNNLPTALGTSICNEIHHRNVTNKNWLPSIVTSSSPLGLLPRVEHLQGLAGAPEFVLHLAQRLRAAQHYELARRRRNVNAKVQQPVGFREQLRVQVEGQSHRQVFTQMVHWNVFKQRWLVSLRTCDEQESGCPHFSEIS